MMAGVLMTCSIVWIVVGIMIGFGGKMVANTIFTAVAGGLLLYLSEETGREALRLQATLDKYTTRG